MNVFSNKMFNDINLFKPDKIIKCRDLKQSLEIYDVLKQMNTSSYAYTINYHSSKKEDNQSVILKIGESSGKQYGERLVRQLTHLNGFIENENPKSTHGNDLRAKLERLVKESKYTVDIHHKDSISIGIWSVESGFRHCNLKPMKSEEEKWKSVQSKWLEGELANLHKITYYCLPPLNFKDPSNCNSYRKYREVSSDTKPLIFQIV